MIAATVPLLQAAVARWFQVALEHVPILWNHNHRKAMRKNKDIERPF